MTALTSVDRTTYRGHTYAATSLDHTWDYKETRSGWWAVTHAPTGRRYWTIGLDQARTETADGTAARLLDIDKPLPPGKPLAKGEHRAICGELSAADTRQMLQAARDIDHTTLDVARWRVRPGIAIARLDACDAGNILGVLYGRAPALWLHVLKVVRPDLLPPDLTAAALNAAAQKTRCEVIDQIIPWTTTDGSLNISVGDLVLADGQFEQVTFIEWETLISNRVVVRYSPSRDALRTYRPDSLVAVRRYIETIED